MSGSNTPSTSWADSPSLSPEVMALIACGRECLGSGGLDFVRVLLNGCVSPELICETAVSHGMIGHLHSLVSAGAVDFDSSLSKRLGELQRSAAILSLRQTSALLRLLERLDGAGVRAMPIKGMAWAESLYGDVAMRVCADTDVLVAHAQMERAREVALAGGYTDAAWYNERIVKWHKEGWGHVEMRSADHKPFLELHWEVFVSMGSRSLHGEDLLARALPTTLLGQGVLGPSWTDGLLIDCVHGTKHEWDTVERMLGMAVRVVRTAAEDWEEIMNAARKAGCRRRLVIAVAHVCRVFGLSVPIEIQKSVARDHFARFFLRYLKPAYLNKDYRRTSREDLARLFARFSTEDSLLLGLRHAAIRFFTPGPEDWEAYSLPRLLEWVYYPLRPLRLAIKWAKQLLGYSSNLSQGHPERNQGSV